MSNKDHLRYQNHILRIYSSIVPFDCSFDEQVALSPTFTMHQHWMAAREAASQEGKGIGTLAQPRSMIEMLKRPPCLDWGNMCAAGVGPAHLA